MRFKFKGPIKHFKNKEMCEFSKENLANKHLTRKYIYKKYLIFSKITIVLNYGKFVNFHRIDNMMINSTFFNQKNMKEFMYKKFHIIKKPNVHTTHK